MSGRMLIIRNPKAGSFISQNSFLEAAGVIFRSDYNIYVYSTTGRGDAARVAAEEGREYDRIVAFGGDGTLHEVINGVMRLPADQRPTLSYVPAGTTNDFASGLGLSRNVQRAAAIALEGEPFPLDIGRFGEDSFFSYVASFGTFTKASYSAPQDLKNLFGYAAYLLEGLKTLADFRPVRLRVRAGGEEYEDAFIFGAVSNAMSIGGIMKFSDTQVSLNDGLFEVLLIRSPKNILQLQQLLLNISARKYAECPEILFLRTDRLEIATDTPLAWTLDGESGGETEDITITNCCRAINILKPRLNEDA